MTLREFQERFTPAIKAELRHQLTAVAIPSLQEAMGHLTGRGKLFRPLLVLASCHATSDSNLEQHVPSAAALELIHIFTLIHDDLPALDNAKLRRGLPAVHVEFGDALAVLAGDGLLSLALRLLANDNHSLSAADHTALLATVVYAVHRVIEGEMLDLQAESRELSTADLQRVHYLKTGALIGACCQVGAILGGAGKPLRPAMNQFGLKLGLAFQIRDDLLSVEESEATTGKTLSSDAAMNKLTYPRLLGLDGARNELESTISQLRELIGQMALPRPQLLLELIDWAGLRRH